MTAPVPDCLRPFADAAAWVAWDLERHGGEPRKVPKSPVTGGNASVSATRSWGTLEAARRLAEVRAYSGIGIVSAAVPALMFFDLDRCLDPATGELTNNDAARLLESCADSYAERTPSGTGVRIIGTAPAITAKISRKGTTPGGLALEVYKAAPRYLTVTALRYCEHPDALADIADVALDLLPLLGNAAAQEAAGDGREDAELVRAIVTGQGFHAELLALSARYLGRGVPAPATVELMRGLMLAHPEPARDARWDDRYRSIPGLVGSAAAKYRDDTAPARRAIVRLIRSMKQARASAAEMRAAVYEEAARHDLPLNIADQLVVWFNRNAVARQGTENA